MKKTSKVFGAIALSAALALGCAVPAFASDPVGTEVTGKSTPSAPGDTDHSADGMHTDVAVKAKISNINVAVPLKVTIVADAAGNTISAPNSGTKSVSGTGTAATATVTGYRIENTSPFPVEIQSITSRNADSSDTPKWTILPANDAKYSVGKLTLTLAPSNEANAGSGNSDGATGVNEGNRVKNNTPLELDGTTKTAGWKIAGGANSASNPRIMGLTLAGTSSELKNVGAVTDTTNSLTTAENAFTVSFTVAATSLETGQQIS